MRDSSPRQVRAQRDDGEVHVQPVPGEELPERALRARRARRDLRLRGGLHPGPEGPHGRALRDGRRGRARRRSHDCFPSITEPAQEPLAGENRLFD